MLPLSTTLLHSIDGVFLGFVPAGNVSSVLSTSDLPRSKPLVMVALPASVSAVSFPFTPICLGQYTHRSFRRWMPTIDTFQPRLSIPLFTYCSKLCDDDGMCGPTVTS